jgi:hypothetical protein
MIGGGSETSSMRPAEVGLAPPRKTQGGGLGGQGPLRQSAGRHDAAIADRATSVPAHLGGDGYLMRINRTLLYTGVFLAAIGGAVLVADFGAISTPSLIDVLRLWPVAVIAIGLGIAFRRTRFSLASGMLAAAVPGLILGGAMAVGPRLVVERGYWDAFKAAYERHYQCADFDANVDFGNVHIDPIGGCR